MSSLICVWWRTSDLVGRSNGPVRKKVTTFSSLRTVQDEISAVTTTGSGTLSTASTAEEALQTESWPQYAYINHTNILPLTVPQFRCISASSCLVASQSTNDKWALLHVDDICASRTIISGWVDESIVSEGGTVYASWLLGSRWPPSLSGSGIQWALRRLTDGPDIGQWYIYRCLLDTTKFDWALDLGNVRCRSKYENYINTGNIFLRSTRSIQPRYIYQFRVLSEPLWRF